MISRPASAEHYDRDAARHAGRYSKARFEEVHAGILDFLPPMPGDILDVGAGIGRDAAALAGRGYRVTAVEPSRALRRQGQARYGEETIEWIEDCLPRLGSLRAAGRRFDFILCSAVLMHVAPGELAESFTAFADLLRPNGLLALSVRNKRADDPPEIFFDLDDAAIEAAAKLAGFSLTKYHTGEDQLGRGDVTWRGFIFVH